jgi:hypothetical protein
MELAKVRASWRRPAALVTRAVSNWENEKKRYVVLTALPVSVPISSLHGATILTNWTLVTGSCRLIHHTCIEEHLIPHSGDWWYNKTGVEDRWLPNLD